MGIMPEDWPAHGCVMIENLVASYNVGDGQPVLHGLSLDIPAGTKFGICGRSGSGTSGLHPAPPRNRISFAHHHRWCRHHNTYTSERLIRDFMREQFASCTVIAVAHRLGAVVDLDRIAVMGGGRLLEWMILVLS